VASRHRALALTPHSAFNESEKPQIRYNRSRLSQNNAMQRIPTRALVTATVSCNFISLYSTLWRLYVRHNEWNTRNNAFLSLFGNCEKTECNALLQQKGYKRLLSTIAFHPNEHVAVNEVIDKKCVWGARLRECGEVSPTPCSSMHDLGEIL
jgi:hypothetical protein